jgi:hypothetical protein
MSAAMHLVKRKVFKDKYGYDDLDEDDGLSVIVPDEEKQIESTPFEIFVQESHETALQELNS